MLRTMTGHIRPSLKRNIKSTAWAPAAGVPGRNVRHRAACSQSDHARYACAHCARNDPAPTSPWWHVHRTRRTHLLPPPVPPDAPDLVQLNAGLVGQRARSTDLQMHFGVAMDDVRIVGGALHP